MDQNSSFTAKYFPKFSDRLFFLCGVLMLCSEIWKQLVLTFALGNGIYDWWYVPFQLCSVPMYILLAYPWLRREGIRRTLLAFLMSYCLMSGIIVFADTSGLQYPIPELTAHSYIWHLLLILIGIGSGITYCRSLRSDAKNILFSRALSRAYPLRPFLSATFLYLSCCVIAETLNLTLDRYGLINMFYINPHYPMQQIVFRDLVPVIGNTAAVLLYVTVTVLGAFLFFLLWRIVISGIMPYNKLSRK